MGDHGFCGGIANALTVLVDNFDHYGSNLEGGPGGCFSIRPDGGRPLPLDFRLTFTLKEERSTTKEISLLGAGLGVEDAGGVEEEIGVGRWAGTCSGMILFFLG